MKTVFLCGAALVALSVHAAAADLSTMPPLLKAPMPVSDWTGFYVGVNGGWGWSDPTGNPGFSATGVTLTAIFPSPQLSGWVFGGQGGFNYQSGFWVGGLEIDVDAADIHQSQSTAFGITTANLSIKINDLGSARARIGFAPAPWGMLYATGGIGWANSTVNVSFTAPGLLGTAAMEADQNSVGWVAGVGAEMKLADHFLFRAEWLHYDFGTQSFNFPNSAIPIIVGQVLLDSNQKVKADVVRGGLGYKF
jgi:outer membrane immunogenic protein